MLIRLVIKKNIKRITFSISTFTYFLAKRLRLNQNPTPAPKPMLLKVDTRDPPATGPGAYHPKTEAISPTNDDGKYAK